MAWYKVRVECDGRSFYVDVNADSLTEARELATAGITHDVR